MPISIGIIVLSHFLINIDCQCPFPGYWKATCIKLTGPKKIAKISWSSKSFSITYHTILTQKQQQLCKEYAVNSLALVQRHRDLSEGIVRGA